MQLCLTMQRRRGRYIAAAPAEDFAHGTRFIRGHLGAGIHDPATRVMTSYRGPMKLRTSAIMAGSLILLGLMDSARYNHQVQACSALGNSGQPPDSIPFDCNAATAWVVVGSIAVLFGFLLAVVSFAQHAQKRDHSDADLAVDALDSTRWELASRPPARHGGPPLTGAIPPHGLRSTIIHRRVPVAKGIDPGSSTARRSPGLVPLKGTLRRRDSPSE